MAPTQQKKEEEITPRLPPTWIMVNYHLQAGLSQCVIPKCASQELQGPYCILLTANTFNRMGVDKPAHTNPRSFSFPANPNLSPRLNANDTSKREEGEMTPMLLPAWIIVLLRLRAGPSLYVIPKPPSQELEGPQDYCLLEHWAHISTYLPRGEPLSSHRLVENIQFTGYAAMIDWLIGWTIVAGCTENQINRTSIALLQGKAHNAYRIGKQCVLTEKWHIV